MSELEIGTGLITWLKHERVSDRYGTVWLMEDGTESPAIIHGPRIGEHGELLVEVIEPRKSPHIGDFFRSFFPLTPKVGQREQLGRGIYFEETHSGIISVGVKPFPKRDTDWLNPRALYNIHNSLVRLLWRKYE